VEVFWGINVAILGRLDVGQGRNGGDDGRSGQIVGEMEVCRREKEEGSGEVIIF
jgi:hypothetical protein